MQRFGAFSLQWRHHRSICWVRRRACRVSTVLRNWTISGHFLKTVVAAVRYWSSIKTFRSVPRPITSAFYSLPAYTGNEAATLAQSRSPDDRVGTESFGESAHVQWKSTVRRNESVSNWHSAPGTSKHIGLDPPQQSAIDWDRCSLSN